MSLASNPWCNGWKYAQWIDNWHTECGKPKKLTPTEVNHRYKINSKLLWATIFSGWKHTKTRFGWVFTVGRSMRSGSPGWIWGGSFAAGKGHASIGREWAKGRKRGKERELECWQLTCQFPTCRSPVFCSFDRDNSMYEKQTWMLTLGLLNRNTGCQCCSVRCSSMLKLLCISIHIPNFSFDFQNFNFSTVRTVKRVELHHYAKFCRNRSNRGRDIVI